jgi:ribosomal protein S18 acetylase RimI-like enzyme
MLPVILRPMHSTDLEAVMAIQALCYHSVEPEQLSVMASKLALPNQCCLIAESANGILGYLICHPWSSGLIPALDTVYTHIPQPHNCLYFHDLAIAPSGRGQCIGQRLVQQALGMGRDLNYPGAALVAIQGSIPFWQQQGFVLTPVHGSVQKSLYHYGTSACYMTRPLYNPVPV